MIRSMLAAAAVLLLVSQTRLHAADIRHFDLPTTERLGNELIRVSEQPDHGLTTPARKRAKDTAFAALQGKLYKEVRYQYVVLDDPDGDGLLVYALAISKKKGDIITGGHFRVSTSADGATAKRVDLLSQLIHQSQPDAGSTLAALAASQIAGKLPVETWIYSSYIYRLPIGVAVMADRSTWLVANGRIVRADNKNLKKVRDVLNHKIPEP